MRKISDKAVVARAVSAPAENAEIDLLKTTDDSQPAVVADTVDAEASTSQPPADNGSESTGASEGETGIEPATANAETKSTNLSCDTVPIQAPAKQAPTQKGSRNIPFITAVADKAVMISKTRGGKQLLEHLPDTDVSARDTEIIDRLITATRALIADGGPVTKPCVKLKVKAGVQIAELRQHYFDTWAAIGANLSGLRTASKTKGALGFNTICTVRLGLQRNKCARLADCHENLIALPEAYQHALRELRKTATDDVVEKVKQVMDEGTSEAQIKNSLSAKFSRNGQDKPSAQQSAKSKFIAALDSIKGLDARRSYCREVLDEATRLVGWTFTESNSVASIAPAVSLKTAADTPKLGNY